MIAVLQYRTVLVVSTAVAVQVQRRRAEISGRRVRTQESLSVASSVESEVRTELIAQPMAAAGAASERGAALLAAVRKNDVEQIKALLKEPGSVVSVDFQSEREAGATALMTCLQSHGKRDGALDTLQCLLSFRPRLDLRNKQGYTALMYASTFGHTECVRLLLAQNPPAAIDAQDNDGMSAAMHAAFAGHLDVIRVMVEASKTPDPTLRNKVRVDSGPGVTVGFSCALDPSLPFNIFNQFWLNVVFIPSLYRVPSSGGQDGQHAGKDHRYPASAGLDQWTVVARRGREGRCGRHDQAV